MPDSFTHGYGSNRSTGQIHVPLPIRVLVADPRASNRRLLVDFIDDEQDMVSCGQVASIDEAVRSMAVERPDVAVIYFTCDDRLDVDRVKELRAQYPLTQLVFVSMQNKRDYAELAIKAGALSYLLKSDSIAQLLKAIRFAARQELYVNRRIVTTLLKRLVQKETGVLRLHFAIDALTDRELEVFKLVGRGKTVMDIAGQLQLEKSTVSTYRRRICRKLGLTSVRELRQFAVQWILASRHVD